MPKARLGAHEGHFVSSISPLRVIDWDWGFDGRNGRAKCFSARDHWYALKSRQKMGKSIFLPIWPPIFDCMRPPLNDPSIKLFLLEILLHNKTYALLFFTSCLSAFVFNPISLIWQSTYFFMAYLRWNNLKKKKICFHVLWMKWFFRRRIQALLLDEIIF